jgi:uncharacterized protein (DUF1919 family)
MMKGEEIIDIDEIVKMNSSEKEENENKGNVWKRKKAKMRKKNRYFVMMIEGSSDK